MADGIDIYYQVSYCLRSLVINHCSLHAILQNSVIGFGHDYSSLFDKVIKVSSYLFKSENLVIAGELSNGFAVDIFRAQPIVFVGDLKKVFLGRAQFQDV